MDVGHCFPCQSIWVLYPHLLRGLIELRMLLHMLTKSSQSLFICDLSVQNLVNPASWQQIVSKSRISVGCKFCIERSGSHFFHSQHWNGKWIHFNVVSKLSHEFHSLFKIKWLFREVVLHLRHPESIVDILSQTGNVMLVPNSVV